jgi:hypothetical protein
LGPSSWMGHSVGCKFIVHLIFILRIRDQKKSGPGTRMPKLILSKLGSSPLVSLTDFSSEVNVARIRSIASSSSMCFSSANWFRRAISAGSSLELQRESPSAFTRLLASLRVYHCWQMNSLLSLLTARSAWPIEHSCLTLLITDFSKLVSLRSFLVSKLSDQEVQVLAASRQ